jgi:hypothetical protein
MNPSITTAAVAEQATGNLTGGTPSILTIWASHRGIVIVLLCAAALIFPNLGKDTLWNDEGDTAYWALSIKEFGVPKAWDGRDFSHQDPGSMNDNLVLVTFPWLSLYATATSLAIFGETAWAARLPFALAGWGTVWLLYLLVWRMTGRKQAALSAAVLLLLSVQFLLYARSCRHYAFNMFFVCLALLTFLKLDQPRKVFAFSAVLILLFYSLPLPGVCVPAALGVLTICYRPFHNYRRAFWISMLMVLPLTLPWLIWSGQRWTTADVLRPSSLAEITARVFQMAIEVMVAVPLLGWLGLWPFSRGRGTREGANLMILCAVVMAALVSADVWTHSVKLQHLNGVRHYCGVIPLGAAISGVLIASISGGRWWTQAGLIFILGATHLGGNLLPWWGAKSMGVSPETTRQAMMIHVPQNPVYMVLRVELPAYVLGLYQDNPGTVSEICRALKAHAAPDDILFTNYAWESIYFYTRLRQAGKIAPGHPIYAAARRQGLPDYVFNASAAQWVVWRNAWAEFMSGNERLKEAMSTWNRRGATLKVVETIRETRWENREDLYFRRFPFFGCLYHTYPSYPEAVLFRVVN